MTEEREKEKAKARGQRRYKPMEHINLRITVDSARQADSVAKRLGLRQIDILRVSLSIGMEAIERATNIAAEEAKTVVLEMLGKNQAEE